MSKCKLNPIILFLVLCATLPAASQAADVDLALGDLEVVPLGGNLHDIHVGIVIVELEPQDFIAEVHWEIDGGQSGVSAVAMRAGARPVNYCTRDFGNNCVGKCPRDLSPAGECCNPQAGEPGGGPFGTKCACEFDDIVIIQAVPLSARSRSGRSLTVEIDP